MPIRHLFQKARRTAGHGTSPNPERSTVRARATAHHSRRASPYLPPALFGHSSTPVPQRGLQHPPAGAGEKEVSIFYGHRHTRVASPPPRSPPAARRPSSLTEPAPLRTAGRRGGASPLSSARPAPAARPAPGTGVLPRAAPAAVDGGGGRASDGSG